MKKSIFRKSAADKDGYLLERRCAIVMTATADDFFLFMPAVATALRELANRIDAGAAGDEAYEKHRIQVDEFAGVEVEVVSLDGLQWRIGRPPKAPAELADALRVLTPKEIEAIG